MNVALAVEDLDGVSGLAQQVGQKRADRAAADDGYISTQECSASRARPALLRG